jgi:hypothetical protein
MMAAALFSLPRANEACHTFKYLIRSSKMLVNEMPVMNLQEPMILLVFLISPVPFLSVFGLLLRVLEFDIAIFLIGVFFVFFASHSNMALFSKQRLKVIAWYNLFVVSGIKYFMLRTMNYFCRILADMLF